MRTKVFRLPAMYTPSRSTSSSGEKFAADGALDYRIVKRTAYAFELTVTGCRYAKF
jgi:hypothetical protein